MEAGVSFMDAPGETGEATLQELKWKRPVVDFFPPAKDEFVSINNSAVTGK